MHARSTLHALVIALTVVVADVVLGAVWTALAWGLRGSAYEDGRPTAEDELSVALGWALLGIAITLHVVVPIGGAIARRWVIPVGVAIGSAAAPLAFTLTLAALAACASTYR